MAKRGNSYHYERYMAEYENGSAARQVAYDDYDYDYETEYDYNSPAIEKRKKRLEKLHEQKIKGEASARRAEISRKRQLENSRGINFVTCILFCIAVVIVYKLAIGYLDVNSNITAMEKQVATVQSDYDTLKAMNDSNLEEINSSIDLKEIYDVAVKDLGMVFANDNQKIEYDNNEASYVRNYEDIPSVSEDNLVDDIMNTLD